MQNDPETSSIFPDNPLISFRHNKNIWDILVHSSLQKNCSLALTLALAKLYMALANVKDALSPTPTLSFRPQTHSFSSGTISHAPPLTSSIASLAINVVRYTTAKLEDL